MRLTATLLSLAFIGTIWFANTTPSQNAPVQAPTNNAYCGSSFVHENKLLEDHKYAQRHAAMEEMIYQQSQNGNQKSQNPPYTLPVVFHVIHQNGTENISDAQIEAGLTHLNASFANTGYYDPSTGEITQISFCLAKRNPEGNASTGIERVSSPLTNLTLESEDQAMKDLSRYEPEHYVNIWLVKEICSSAAGCGVAGYAYFPSAHGTNIDGIVVEAKWVGTSEGNSSVLTHEVGHYLGLYHTFEGGCQNADCLTDGDKICDTPPDQSTAAVPCGSTANSCFTDTDSGFATDQNDMYINYMDYGDWDCYSAFTAGQVDRMHNVICGVRMSLLESDGCLDPCTIPIFVEVNTDLGDSVQIGQQITYTAVGQDADNFEWFLDGISVGTGAQYSHVFPAIGFYDVVVTAGNSDPNCSASSAVQTTVYCPVQASFSPSSFEVGAGTVVFFNNESLNGDDFIWSVDGNIEANTTGFFFQFDTPGNYLVELQADNGECSDDFGVIITVGLTGLANTGLPIWPLQGGADGGFHILDWRIQPPYNSAVTQLSDASNGATGAAFNACGDVAFFAVHTALSTPEQLFLFAADGTPLLTNTTPNAPGLNAVRGPTELQVVPVPQSNNEWYLIYREYASDSGAPLSNAAYLTLNLMYSKVRLEEDGAITVVDRDIELTDNNGTPHNYADGIAVSRTVNGNTTEHYVYVGRRSLNQNSLSLDRFILDATGINWQANTGVSPATFWQLTFAGSPVELSPTEDKVVVGNRNQWSNYQDYIVFDTDNFSNSTAQAIIADNLVLVPDGGPDDLSNVLPVSQTITQLGSSSTYPLQFLRNFSHKISRMEFSPNGRFLYIVGGGFQSGSSQYSTLTYLAQIDLETSPLEVRLQIQDTPTAYNPISGLACLHSVCGDDWRAINDLESSFDGNLYFRKRGDNTLYVIPNPNDFMPQNLIPSNVDLSTSNEPNINLIGLPGNIPDQIDGFNYLTFSSQSAEIVVTGLDCEENCRAPFDIIVSSTDGSFEQNFTIETCPQTIFICGDTSLIYNISDPLLGITFPAAIQNGQVIYPSGEDLFDFSESAGCPDDCDNLPLFMTLGASDKVETTSTILTLPNGNLLIGLGQEDGLSITEMTISGILVNQQKIFDTDLLFSLSDLKLDSEGFLIGAGYEGSSSSNLRGYAFKYDLTNEQLLWITRSSLSQRLTSILDIPNEDYYLVIGTHSSSPPFPGYGDDALVQSLNKTTGQTTNDYASNYTLGSPETFVKNEIYDNKMYHFGRYSTGAAASTFRAGFSCFSLDGTELWSILLHIPNSQSARLYGRDFVTREDGIYLLYAGDDNGTSTSNTELFTAKISHTGNLLWVKKYDVPSMANEYGEELVETDNGFIILGRNVSGDQDLFLAKIDYDGNLNWARQYLIIGSETLAGRTKGQMIASGDNFIFTAIEADQDDAIVLKVDQLGFINTECLEVADLAINATAVSNPTATPVNLTNYNISLVLNNILPNIGSSEISINMACLPACEEICSNGIDDDEDGFIDCDDPDLFGDCCCYTPPILNLGNDTTLCENAVIPLNAGAGFSSYLWFDGSTESSYTAFSAGTYSVIVTDSCGNMQNDEITISIDPASGINLGPDTTICLGASLTFSVPDFDTYEWLPAGIVDCANCQTVNFTGGTGTHTLAVVGSTSSGCISVDSIQITVTDATGVGDYTEASICEGDSYTFAGEELIAAGLYFDTIGTAPCITIDTLNLSLVPPINTNDEFSICEGHFVMVFGVSINEAGIYSETFTSNVTGCDSTHTIAVEVLPNIVTDESLYLCDGQSVVLFGETVSTAGSYSETFSAENGCDSTHTIVVQILPNILTSENIALCEGQSIQLFGETISTAGTYSGIFDAENGCDSTHTVVVTINPTAETEEEVFICEGESALIFGQEETIAGVFTQTFFTSEGCDSIHHVTLTVHPNYSIDEFYEICEGESISIFGQAVTMAGVYIDQNTTIHGCDSITTATVEVLPTMFTSESIDLCDGNSVLIFGEQITQAGTYSATFTGINGCDSTHTVTVSILDQPTTTETISGLCPDETVVVFGQTVNSSGTYAATFTAANGCDSIHQITVEYKPENINLAVIVICEGESTEVFGEPVSTPGVYSQVFEGADGCDSIEQIQVIQEFFLGEVVISPPFAGNEGYTARILAAGGGWPYTYEWSFTDEIDEWMFDVPPGEHSITVTSVHGCVYVLDFVVDDFLNVFSQPNNTPYYVPNAFSPNQDGINDYFTLYGNPDEVIEIKHMAIFSRWGEHLFERRDFKANRDQLGWDGSFRGQAMANGVYVYTIDVELKNGRTISLKGDVLLIK